ncbi:hypothetical protein HCU74_05560 [Spongiibacter sp. KMU-166]|uniref:Uncharacterized protein n=1 Tax=Spongiibacter thalassae TaxID=2721624 RepID=A0ABX1GD83_9GAMM|nr:hypothetical protein [Spongiibacter thalassae]NKI16886.1 hypothetical protein [Spongiibacter thalassae]
MAEGKNGDKQKFEMRRLRGLAHARYLRERWGLVAGLTPEEIYGYEVPWGEAVALYRALRSSSKEGGSVDMSDVDSWERVYVEFCMNLYERRQVLLAEKERLMAMIREDRDNSSESLVLPDRERLIQSLTVIELWLTDDAPQNRLEAIPGVRGGRWEVVWPSRLINYTRELCIELQNWCDENKGVPSALQVLNEWKRNPPIGITDVSDNRFCLTNTQGERWVDYEALQRTINNHVHYLGEDSNF